MSRASLDLSDFQALNLEGALISPAILARIARSEASEQSDEQYSLPPGLTLREELPRFFRIGQALFQRFAAADSPGAGATKRLVVDLLEQVFGFDDLDPGGSMLVAGDGRVPIVITPPGDALDRPSDLLSIERRHSAASLLQETLNREDAGLWGLACNGHMLRLMRTNNSLTRPAWIEANLVEIFGNEDFASFSALWLLIHRSRFGRSGTPQDSALERWRDTGTREGEAARDRLRDGVEEALRVLGSGFLDANPELRARLAAGDLGLDSFFNELLRLVYRLIFLMVAEDRDLLHQPGAFRTARDLYRAGYSLTELRRCARRRSSWDRHHDRWEGLKITFRALATGQPRLGLPALGGLFAPEMLASLRDTRLPNRALMEGIYRLSWLAHDGALVRINWRAMETEELGSVYESLLELTPRLSEDARQLIFADDASETRGNQRKTTGSYYTPDSLVEALLDSALDPVLERVEAGAENPAEALLKLTVIDPACGSGHFLLAAGRRIADRVAYHRGGGTPGAGDYRQALRDVARSCLHGVDRNPMAVELAKVALWIETVEPGKPLGFLDTAIRCGDALLGVHDLQVLEDGIPDDAYKALSGDDQQAARYYRDKNRRERAERDHIASGFGLHRHRDFMRDFAELRDMPEDTEAEVAAKARRFRALMKEGKAAWDLKIACDLYTAAFLLPKRKGGHYAGPDGLPRRGAEMVPTSGTVWESLRGKSPFGPMFGAAMDAAGAAGAFHWPLEFPNIMARGGFDVVLGNPPFSAAQRVTVKNFAKVSYPSSSRASNTAATFVELSSKISGRGGSAGLVMPKSLTYSFAWSEVRESLLDSVYCVIDFGEAWKGVNLEQVVVAWTPGAKVRELKVSEYNVDSLFGFRSVPKSVASRLGIFPTGLRDPDREIVSWLDLHLRERLGNYVYTRRGVGIQRLIKPTGSVPVLAGREISEFTVSRPCSFIEEDIVNDRVRVYAEGSVVFQNIVAHLRSPSDHIRLIGAVMTRPAVPLDTVNIVSSESSVLNGAAIAGFLMSNFVNWFVYVCCYNRAIRTMHFDNYVLKRIPLPSLEWFDGIREVSERLLRGQSEQGWHQLNRVVYEAFGLRESHQIYLDNMHKSRMEKR